MIACLLIFSTDKMLAHIEIKYSSIEILPTNFVDLT